MIAFLCTAAFCLLFSTVYNNYGHGVHSFFMSFLFLWPFFGLVWYGLMAVLHTVPQKLSKNLLNAGVATITAGSLLRGIFDIAGTSSPYQDAFFIVGIVLIAIGVLALLGQRTMVQG